MTWRRCCKIPPRNIKIALLLNQYYRAAIEDLFYVYYSARGLALLRVVGNSFAVAQTQTVQHYLCSI